MRIEAAVQKDCRFFISRYPLLRMISLLGLRGILCTCFFISWKLGVTFAIPPDSLHYCILLKDLLAVKAEKWIRSN